ncbi:MAG: hypothetical protein KAH20_04770 [Methylococcales bacterium]|nr:hypothetical protein [Methylococcales bacterium]
MLETIYKVPTPGSLSYPVGAELISNHIEQECRDKGIEDARFYTSQLPQVLAS